MEMMSANTPFDTHRYIRRLEEAGFTPDQAQLMSDERLQDDVRFRRLEGQEPVTRDFLRETLSHYPTREDLRNELRHFATKQDLFELRSELKQDMASLENRLTLRLGKLLALGLTLSTTVMGIIMAVVVALL